MPEAYDQTIQSTIGKIEASKSLKADEALALANEVAKAVSVAMREAEQTRDFTRMEQLARHAESAYLLASKKVPTGDRDVIAFASTYWSLRADHARLDAQLAQTAPFRPTTVAPSGSFLAIPGGGGVSAGGKR